MRNALRIVIAAFCMACGIYAQPTINKPCFKQWQTACNQLPAFSTHGTNAYQTALNSEQLLSALKDCCTNLTAEKKALLGSTAAKKTDFYAVKRVVPTYARVAIHGDIHGDIHSLNAFIDFCTTKGYMSSKDPFVITDPNFYILFLGDYVDRGWYGAEALYTIARLKCANPDQVMLVRGNHEDTTLNSKYGFAGQLERTFYDADAIMTQCQKLYDLLPVCIYLGTETDFVQCCHGGIEIGFDPRALLATHKKKSAQAISTLSPDHFVTSDTTSVFGALKQFFTADKQIDTINGFMWNDFIVDPQALLQIQLSPRDGYAGTIFRYGKEPTHAYLQACSRPTRRLRSIFRAHQHSDSEISQRMLNLDQIGHEDDIGVAKLWIESVEHAHTAHLLNGIDVVTFWVTPNTGYKPHVHAFGILSMATQFSSWRLTPVVLQQ